MIIKKHHGSYTIDLIFSAFIVLLPFLYQYKGVGSSVSFGEMLIIPVTLLIVIKDFKGKLKGYDKWLLTFYCVTILSTLFCLAFPYFDIAAASTVFVRLIVYAVIILVGRKHFDLSDISRFYEILVFFFSVYLIVQYLYHYIIGGYLPIYLKFNWIFPPESRAASLEAYYRWGFRASSLFLEPSYFALYALPAVPMLLYEHKNTFQSIELAVIIAALVLSGANSALVGLVIVFGGYLFLRPTKSGKNLFSRITIVIIAVGLIVAYFYFSENTEYFFIRFNAGGSFKQRILRGILIYQELPIFHKVLGVGLNNLQPYMIANGISTLYDETNLNYSCSIIQTLNYSGIIGATVLVVYLSQLKKKAIKPYQIVLWLLIVFMACYESILFTYRFAFLVLLFEGGVLHHRHKERDVC